MNNKPTVLTIAGHDPTGGAGIQADIESISSLGAYPCSIITALTIQNTENVEALQAIDSQLIDAQLAVLCADMEIDAIKIGLLGNLANILLIADFLQQIPKIPVILDPVFAAGGGKPLARQELITAVQNHLLPHITLLTPNSHEARQLAPQASSLSECAGSILNSGCQQVLITGTHEPGGQVINQLYQQSGLTESFSWPRLPHEYHGSGCTLSAAIAACLAHGMDMHSAVLHAQQFTWDALLNAHHPGQHQYIPNRSYY